MIEDTLGFIMVVLSIFSTVFAGVILLVIIIKEKRNTAKEKRKRNKHYPYKKLKRQEDVKNSKVEN